MKYLIDHQVINSACIAHVEYEPVRTNINGVTLNSQCAITLTSTEELINDKGDPVTSASEQVILAGNEADLFWEVYANDAHTVISPKQPQAA